MKKLKDYLKQVNRDFFGELPSYSPTTITPQELPLLKSRIVKQSIGKRAYAGNKLFIEPKQSTFLHRVRFKGKTNWHTVKVELKPVSITFEQG